MTFVLSHSVISPTHNSPTYFYDFSKGDYEGLSYSLANCDFSDCYNSDDVEFIWFIIKGYIISAMELYIRYSLDVTLHSLMNNLLALSSNLLELV